MFEKHWVFRTDYWQKMLASDLIFISPILYFYLQVFVLKIKLVLLKM